MRLFGRRRPRTQSLYPEAAIFTCDQFDCDEPGTRPVNTNYGFLGTVCERHWAEIIDVTRANTPAEMSEESEVRFDPPARMRLGTVPTVSEESEQVLARRHAQQQAGGESA